MTRRRAKRDVTFLIQGRYDRPTGWETVNAVDTWREAITSVREYRANEPEYTFRIHYELK